jgi:transcriptional adapter 2-alpha
MPRRREFDCEHENEAEVLISEMDNKAEDQVTDEKYSFNILTLYNQRIKERKKRRDFLID